MLMFVSNGQPKNDDNSNTPLSLSLSLSLLPQLSPSYLDYLDVLDVLARSCLYKLLISFFLDEKKNSDLKKHAPHDIGGS